MGRKKKSNFLVSAHRTLRKKSVVAAVYIVLRLLVILVMVAQFFNGNFENVFLCILTLILFLLPTIFEKSLQIDLPNALEIIILLFIFAAEILGEIRAFYTTFAYWDTMLHTINGFLCAAIGFSLVDMCNRHKRVSLSLSPVYMAIVAFCFSMTILTSSTVRRFYNNGSEQQSHSLHRGQLCPPFPPERLLSQPDPRGLL